MSIRAGLVAAVAAVSTFIVQERRASALEGDSSVFIFLGEALGPANLRVSWSRENTWDIGLDTVGMGLYGGARLWSRNLYAGGGGILLGPGSVGLYGSVGVEYKFLRFVGIAAEFRAVTTMEAVNTAVGMIGLGGVW